LDSTSEGVERIRHRGRLLSRQIRMGKLHLVSLVHLQKCSLICAKQAVAVTVRKVADLCRLSSNSLRWICSHGTSRQRFESFCVGSIKCRSNS
jgi:predicted transcriptional regulator of viral defense system